jgi:hypothetical protein
MAGLVCARPGHRSRLFYRLHVYHQRKGERKGLSEAYAPAAELNPTEGVWANVRTALGDLAARGVDSLAATVKTLLKRIQYRPSLIDGFISETGLIVQPG